MEKCTEDTVFKVWDWCIDIYSKHGIRLKFPNNTKPQNTYQWRYCRSLTNKFIEWGFDDDTAQYFINVAVGYSKQLGTLRKGLAALHQNNMLETVHKLMLRDKDDNQQLISLLSNTHKWLSAQLEYDDPIDILLDRENKLSFPNIVIWYQANKIPRLYLALSKSCHNAIQKLGYPERDMLPSVAELYKLRSNFIKEPQNLKKVRFILGKDWRNCAN